MSDTVLKRLNVSDVFTIPYEANKLWSVTASDFTEYGIFFQTGSYTSSINKTDFTYSNLLYKSVLVNYYPEFYPTNSLSTSSYYQTVNYTVNLTSTDYAVSGALRLGNLYSIEKNFYTSSIQIINIPNTLYSNKIIPTTFQATVSGGLIYDDGEYNLRWSGSSFTGSVGIIISQSSCVGNLFYEQGLGVLTRMSASFDNIQFQNSYILYEQNMVCRVKDYEFNTSYNPTLTTGSLGFVYESSSIWITSSTIPYNYSGTYYTYPDNQLKDFATASYFTPYVGSLGFYNDSNQLLAVAKMSQPVPLSNATDLTFLVKLDW